MDSVSEVQITGVATILEAVLSPDNDTRRTKEAEIHKLRHEHPNELTICLLHILSQAYTLPIKSLAAVLLRQMFSNLSAKTLQAWERISPQTQGIVKTQILHLIASEPEFAVKKKLGEAVGELAVTVLAADDPGVWPDLMPFLLQSITSQDHAVLSVGFHIMSGLFTFFYEEFLKQKEALKLAFETALNIPNAEVKVTCIDAICSLLGIMDLRESPYFADVFPKVLENTLALVDQNPIKAEEALKHLRGFSESEPKFFKDKLAVVFQFCDHLCQHNTENLYIKYLALDIIVTLAERLEEEFRGNPSVSNGICERTFKMMISVDSEVDEAWETPPEGFSEKEETEDSIDIDYSQLGRKLLSRMLEHIGDELLMPGLLNLVKESLSPNITDWRVRYAGLMTITELAQFIQDSAKVAEIVPILQTHMQPNLHGKLRVAALICIARLCEDYEEEFQQTHHLTLMPMIIAGLDDSIQRVVASAARALKKFMETAGQTLANEYVRAVLPKLIVRLSSNNCSFVLERVLEALTSLAESCKSSYAEFYKDSMSLLYELVNKYSSNDYKRLRGKSIQCLTIICSCVGKDLFQQYAPSVIQLLRDIQASISQDDSLQAYLFAAWQRISATLGSDFAHYLPEIIPQLLRILRAHAEVSISTEPETFMSLETLMQGKEKVSVTTSDIENKEVALQTVLTIVDIMGGAYAPFVQETVPVIVPIISNKLNETLRSSAASIAASLVISIKESNHPDAPQNCVTVGRTLLSTIWQAAQEEFDTETLVSQLTAIKTIIETPGVEFLSAEEVNGTGEYMMKILEASLKRRERNSQIQDELSDEDEDEDELIQELNKKDEDNLHTAISEVLGALFKTHRMLSLNIVEFLYTNVLSKFLQPESVVNDQKFAIFVIDDIIEFVGQDLAGNKWSSLAEALIKFCTSPDDAIRQAAAYGIGILATYSSNEIYGPWSELILKTLNNALAIPVSKSKKGYGHARDNIIAAVGKVIKNQSSNIDVNLIVPLWIGLLPLKFDKVEARMMHDLLADICTNNIELAIGSNRERMPNIILLFAEILESKLIDKDTVPKVKNVVTSLQSAGYPELNNIWAQLTDIQRKKLTNLINS